MKYGFLILLVCFQPAFSKDYFLRLGDAKILVQHIVGHGKTFVHLHQNETTALAAAKEVVRKEGGSLITLVHNGGRNIVFRLKRKRYEFDPNRIFTDNGIKKTLSQFGPYSQEAHAEVNKLASHIKRLLPSGKIVAVHNNASYSLKDYLPGHELASDAQAMHMSPKNHYRNFYLVTKLTDFTRLKMQGYNGILQKKSATDDGSLSVLFAKKDYINVEAGYDQLPEQIKMLSNA